MNIALINPPLLSNKGDIYGGIPSLPTGITYIAAYLRHKGHNVSLIDCFGETPLRKSVYKNKYFTWGLDINEAVGRIPKNVDLVGISVHSPSQDSLAKDLIQLIKNNFKSIPIVVGGAYPTTNYSRFLEMGADFVVLSEGEETCYELLRYLKGEVTLESIDGLAWQKGINPKTKFIEDLDSLPYPAIDLLPLENYWKLGYAHGPVKGKYAFLITSRGCPYACNFCAAAYIWQRKFRFHSPKRVVDEIEYFNTKYGIDNFHIQDDGFATDRQRVLDISDEIKNRKLKINWGLPAGVKAETLDPDTLKAMRDTGFNYLSVSPESGSDRVLNLMNKPLDRERLLQLLRAAKKLKINTQSCFVLGYPGENDADRNLTVNFIKKISKIGVDEIAIYIMTPLPGASIFSEFFPKGMSKIDPEELTFSPFWRPDYKVLNRIRLKMYLIFIFYKAIFQPAKIAKSIVNIFTKNFDLKMEMTFYRILKTNIE